MAGMPKESIKDTVGHVDDETFEIYALGRAPHLHEKRRRRDRHESSGTVDPRLELGSNRWLFLGSEDGGRWGAVIYSMIGTCKLIGINPEAYLKEVSSISITPQSQIDSLMPRLWKPPDTW